MASGARGGGADHLLGLLPALAEVGVEVAAAVGADGPLLEQLAAAGFPVAELELMGPRIDPRSLGSLRRAVRDLGADLLHFHGTRAAFWGALGGMGRLPSVYTAHGLAFRQAAARHRQCAMVLAERLICARSARVICVARADLAELERRRMLRRGQGTYIGNAVAWERLERIDRATARARLGLAAEAQVVGTVARLVPQKEVGAFVDLLARLPEAVGLVIGDGPERSALEARAAAGGGRLVFLGSRDDVGDLLAALDLFVLTSRWEGEPVALLEAMASGLACLCTATSGAAELIADRVTGRLVPVGAVGELASTAAELLADPPARAALGRAARATVVGRRFSEIAVRVVRVYRSAISLPASGGLE